MAEISENAENQLVENLFQVIDRIATKRVENLQFDKTLTCQIVDDTNSAKGEYLVSNAGSEFLAYSENDSYKNENWVYVTVPNGDMNQQKIIVGKYIADNTEYSTYKDPLDTYLDLTGNLIDGTVNPEEEKGLVANSGTKEIIIWQTGDISTRPYATNQLNKQEYQEILQSQIQELTEDYNRAKETLAVLYTIDTEPYNTALQELDDAYAEQLNELIETKESIDVLNYGVSDTARHLSQFNRLGLRANFMSDLLSYKTLSGHYGLRVDIIYRDPGSTSSDTNYLCKSLQLDTDTMFGNPYNFVTWSQQQSVFDLSEIQNIVGLQLVFYQDDQFQDEMNNLIPGYEKNSDDWENYLRIKNILVKDIYISLGYDLSEFKEDTLFLYSFEPLTYSSYLTAAARDVLTQQHPELNLNSETDTQEALKIVNKKNLYLRWVHIDDEDGATAIEDISDFGTWEHIYEENGEYVSEEKPYAKVHWYRWTLADGVADELAGPFWQRQDGTNGSQNLEDAFIWENVYPDPMTQLEKFKVIVEYPSLDYLNYEFANSKDQYLDEIDDDLYAAAAVECFPDGIPEDNELYVSTVIKAAYLIKKQEAEEGYLASLLGQCHLYSSPELVFNNEQDVPSNATMDLVQALQLVCDEEGLNGVYRIYNDDNQIINSGEATQNRILKAQFNTLITGDGQLDSAEIIRWYFPMNETMIEPPVEGCEYTFSDGVTTFAGLVNDDREFCIERQGVALNATGERPAGSVIPTQLEQIFRIKPTFTQTFINNTIRCEIYKNNRTYNAEVVLYFATVGTNGADYDLTVTYEELVNNKWQYMTLPVFTVPPGTTTSTIKVIPHIFNYEKQEITDQYSLNNFSGSWYSEAENSAFTLEGPLTEPDPRNTGKNRIYFTISATGNPEDLNEYKYFHHILKISVEDAIDIYSTQSYTNNNGQTVSNDNTQIDAENDTPHSYKINLTGYYPIAVRFNSNYVKIDGDDRITYDSSGTNPTYYKGQYALYYLENGVLMQKTPILWYMYIGQDRLTDIQYYPQIDESTGELVVPSLFISKNDPKVSICALEENELSPGQYKVSWCQPLYISQELYDSVFLNSWDGSLSIDEKNGTTMSAMIGAGYKDENNLFNGVLMGQVGTKTSHPVGTKTSDTGLYGFHEGEQSFGFTIDGTAFLGKYGHGRIEFDGNHGEIKSTSFDAANFGMKIDLDDAYIDFKSESGGQIHLGVNSQPSADGIRPGDSESSFFRITDNQNNTILLIDPEDDLDDNGNFIGPMFLQTSNFSNDDKTGIKIDLANGQLTGYNFTLTALNEDDTGVILSSSGDPYLQVTAINPNTNQLQNILLISDNDLYLQSPDFDNSNLLGTISSGTRFDVMNGQLFSYNFTFIAEKDDLTGIRMSSIGDNDFPYLCVKDKASWTGATVNNIQTLLEITSDTFILQSADFNTTTCEGTQLDIMNGSILSYDFTLQAIQDDKGVILSSSGNPYLQIVGALLTKDAETDEIISSEQKTNLLIDNENFYLQSLNYVSGSSGAKFNIADGSIEAYSGTGMILIDSKSLYPLVIGSPETFCVEWDGSINAALGFIGGWTITPEGLFSDMSDDGNSIGVSLYSSSADTDLRIAVGSITTIPYYYLRPLVAQDGKQAQPIYDYDTETGTYTQEQDANGNWVYVVIGYTEAEDAYYKVDMDDAHLQLTTAEVYKEYTGPKKIIYKTIDSGDYTDKSFSVTADGQLEARNALFPTINITEGYAEYLEVDSISVQSLDIPDGGLYYDETQVTWRSNTIVYDVTKKKSKIYAYRKILHFLGYPSDSASTKGGYKV